MKSSRAVSIGGGAVLALVGIVAVVRLAAVPAGPEFPAMIAMAATQTPSGVAVDKPGNVYVSVREAGHGLIWKYTREGVATVFADLGLGDIYGLIATARGDLYAAMVGGPAKGVYRIDRSGEAELLPGSEQITYPNALAFDDRGTLYITDSKSGTAASPGPGGIWRIEPGGVAEVWLQHSLLTGFFPPQLGGPVGANGIAYFHGELFVANTNTHRVVRVPIAHDGSAGIPTVWAEVQEVPESPLAGSPFPLMPDGLVLDVFGNVYLTILTRNAVVRIGADDQVQQTIAALGSSGDAPSAMFDTPASLAFGTGAGEQQNLFVTSLGWMKQFVPTRTWPGPSLIKIPAGAPGRPLH